MFSLFLNEKLVISHSNKIIKWEHYGYIMLMIEVCIKCLQVIKENVLGN